MAYIGEMQYLTIGNNTYSLPTGGGSGTVTSVAAGVGLTTDQTNGGAITSTGTIKAKLNSETSLGTIGTTSKLYAVGVDTNGKLCVSVPWNDNTNTTYSLSNALSSHKFTETLTAGGSGSGTSTATMEFAAGTGITLTDDTTNKKITIACSITDTDEKVKRTTYTSTNPLYPILHTDKTGTSAAYTSDISFYQYYNTAGGYRRLDLGNSTAYKSTGGAYGTIRLYGSAATYYGDLVPGVLGTTSGDGHISANRTWTLPDKTGTIALTSDIPAYTDTNTWRPIQLNGTQILAGTTGTNALNLKAGTNVSLSNSSGTVTINGPDLSGYAQSSAVPTKTSDLTNDGDGTSAFATLADIGSFGGGTVTSVGVTNATNGGLSISGSPITTSGTITIGHSNVLSSAQTTQAVYPIKIDKNGHISAYGSAVTIPTKTSDLTNDSGFITGYTETDPTVPSWAKASTKPTYTASEVGALPDTTTIPSITLNGTSINSPSFYAPTSAGTDGYVLKSNGSGAPTWTSATLTDTQVTSTAVTAATTNYLVGSTTSTTITGGLSKHASGVLYTTANSGTSGYTQLRLGNTTATTSAGGKEGQIRLYGTNATYYLDLKPGAIASSNKTITFPNKTGTVALTDDIPTISYPVTSVNNKTGAVSLTASDVGALPSTTTIPSITLNGSSSTSPSFYAPTGAGTNGQYLKSTGSGAPSWGNFPTIPSITLNGSSTTSPSFYAPTSGGTSGYYLKSMGLSEPAWAAFPTIPSITINGVSATTVSFYAPTSAGTSGYYLKSTGNGAPTWSAKPSYVASDIEVDTGTFVDYTVDVALDDIDYNIKNNYLPLSAGSTKALTSNLYMENPYRIYGKTTGLDTDIYLDNLQPVNENNNCVIGFGGYDNEIGKTNIYGNDINVFCNNTIRFDKSIAFMGHSSVMGTIINTYLSSNKSCASGTWVALCNATVPAGTWIGQYGVRWPTSETGVRQANVSSTSGNNTQQITAKPIGGTSTQVRWTEILSLNSDTTLYLNAYHNHGSALTLPASSSGSGSYMRFIRIL